MKKTKKVPDLVYTQLFIRFIQKYTEVFKHDRRLGRWLVEYDKMLENGQLSPKVILAQYVNILRDVYDGNFLAMQAYWYIGINAFDAACQYVTAHSFMIKTITGFIALDEDDDELTDLSFEEALSICKAMNTEAEETLFRVYDNENNLIY